MYLLFDFSIAAPMLLLDINPQFSSPVLVEAFIIIIIIIIIIIFRFWQEKENQGRNQKMEYFIMGFDTKSYFN